MCVCDKSNDVKNIFSNYMIIIVTKLTILFNIRNSFTLFFLQYTHTNTIIEPKEQKNLKLNICNLNDIDASSDEWEKIFNLKRMR